MKREVMEETGLEVEPIRYLGSFASKYGETGDHTVSVAFLCEITGGQLRVSEESSAHDWFPLDKMPEMAHRDDQLAVERLRSLDI